MSIGLSLRDEFNESGFFLYTCKKLDEDTKIVFWFSLILDF